MILAVLFIGFVVAPLVIQKYADGSVTHPVHWFIIAAIASIAGTGGDLFESKLKRMANVKDSGHIMPGHGGFLDRFDSLLFAIPFVWLYVHFVLNS
jgi:phosphatidate cytidylyltransferase